MTISEFINKVGFSVKQEDVKKVNDTISGIKNTATKLLGALGIGLSLASMNKLIEEFGAVNNGIRSAVGNLDNLQEIQQQILAGANEARIEYSSMAGTVSNLVKSSSSLFPTEDAVEFTTNVTKLLKTAGRSQQNIATIMDAMNKSFQKGVVESETLNQLLENSPEAANILAKHLGVAKSQLLDMAANGRISVNDLKMAFIDAGEEINAEFQNVDMTISDALLNIRNRWGLWLAETDKTLGITKEIAKTMVSGFNVVMNVLTRVRTAVVWLNEKLGGTQNLLKLVAIAAGAIFVALNGQKILNFLKSAGSMLNAGKLKILAIVAVIILVALLIEDLFNLLQGNNSLIGEMLTKAGVDVDAFRETIKEFLAQIQGLLPILKEFAMSIGKELLSAIKQILPSLIKIVATLLPTLADILNKVGGVLIQVIKTILPVLVSLIEQLLPFLVSIIDSILPVIISLVEALLPIVMLIIDTVLPLAIKLISTLLPIALQFISQVLPVILSLIEAIVPLLVKVINSILPVLLEIINSFLPILEPILDLAMAIIESYLPILIAQLECILPILEPILAILDPILSLLTSIMGLKAKFDGWMSGGLKWVMELLLGGGDKKDKDEKKVNGYARGTENTPDTFIAGEEGPELITGSAGKKVFTALATGNIFRALAMLSRSANANPSTVSSTSNSRVINQHNEFINTFNGEPSVQKSASGAMRSATDDATAELARALALA